MPIKLPSLSQIMAMSASQRQTLYRNAVKLGTPEAKAVIALIVQNGLLLTSGGGLPRDHPIIQRIEDIACSAAGRAAARQASDDGLPAMAGVDPLLAAGVGGDYGLFDTTQWAGTFVAAEMSSQGYRQVSKRPMPPGCVAKTAAFFRKR